MKASLIVYKLSKLDQYHKVLVNRALFGYIDNSNKGNYRYKRSGVLESIPHLRLLKGVIVVKIKDKKKITSILNKHRVDYMVFNITIKRFMLH